MERERGAAKEGVILDLLPHVFPFLRLFLTSDVQKIELLHAWTWREQGFPEKDFAETCAQLVFQAKGAIIEARVGKGVAMDRKELGLDSQEGCLKLDLGKGGGVEYGDWESVTRPKLSPKELGYGWVVHRLLNGAPLEFQSLQTGIEISNLLLAIRESKHLQYLGEYAHACDPVWQTFGAV